MEKENRIVEPMLDMEEIQKKANEYALKGAVECIKEYYTGYNSPFKKEIENRLNQMSPSFCFTMPEVMGVINESLSSQIDIIANEAIAKSYVPLVRKFLTRGEEVIRVSDIVDKFKQQHEYDDEPIEVEISKNERYGWYDMKLECGDEKCRITLHEDSKNEQGQQFYSMLGLPYEHKRGSYDRNMKITLDEGTFMEIPFTCGILHNNFLTYVANLVMFKTKIVIDKTYFDDEYED